MIDAVHIIFWTCLNASFAYVYWHFLKEYSNTFTYNKLRKYKMRAHNKMMLKPNVLNLIYLKMLWSPRPL